MDSCPSLSTAGKWRCTEVQKLGLTVQKLEKLGLETDYGRDGECQVRLEKVDYYRYVFSWVFHMVSVLFTFCPLKIEQPPWLLRLQP